jgi:hypothetical protein
MKKSQLKQLIKEEIRKVLNEDKTADRILDKIRSQGMDSLTKLEKDYLKDFSLGKTNLIDPYDEENIRLNEKKSFLSFIKSNYDKILDSILKNDFNNDMISFINATNIDKQYLVTGKWNNYIDEQTSLDSVDTIYGEDGKDTPLDFSEVLIVNGGEINYDKYLKDRNISQSIKNMFKYLEEYGNTRNIIISNYSAKDVPNILGGSDIEPKLIPTIKYKNKPIYYRIIELEFGMY